MNKKIIKRVLIFIAILLVLSIVSIQPIDKSPLDSQPYVTEMMNSIDSAMAGLDTSRSLVKVGWSKKNITPEEPVRIVGFGYQSDFEIVHDSTFVRTVVFENKQKKYALISFDLLFVHPNLVEHIESELQKHQLNLDGIYFAATHSHNSFGGWGYDRIFDEVMLDGEENKILQCVTNQTIASLSESISKVDSTLIGASSFNFNTYIRNRVSNEGLLDPWMHVVKLIHPETQDTAIISTFSAHATCLFSQMDLNTISSDYPGVLSAGVENNENNNLLVFCAGGVGSFSPTPDKSNFEKMELYGNNMLTDLKDSLRVIESKPCYNLGFFEIDLLMPKPCFKVSNNYQIRPWLFNVTLGIMPSKLKYLHLGSSSFVGFPGELSGELYLNEIEAAHEKGEQLIVTSFNGNYTGYTMPDHYYYSKDVHEVTTMNWFGPYNGTYFYKIVHQVNTSN